MSEETNTPRPSIDDIATVTHQSLQTKLSESYNRVMSAPVEFSMPIIHSAVIDLVNEIEKRGSNYFNRDLAKKFYASFFTKQYNLQKNRDSGRLPRL
jgi:hypothetical protein